MASIVELVFQGKLTVSQVTEWLLKESSCGVLEEASLTQPEFVQYLLNFLRDQSAPILQGCRSANATPSKTPTVLKSQRSITFGEDTVKTSTPRTTGLTKRVQLFAASPLEGDSLTCSINPSRSAHQNESSLNCPSFNTSRNTTGSVYDSPGHGSYSLNSSHNTGASGSNSYQYSPLPGGHISPYPNSGYRKQNNRLTPGSESFSQGKRNRNNSFGSYTPDAQRSQHKHSLGEFFVASNTRKKKSPTTGRREDSSPQIPPGGWKSGGKGKSGSDKKKWHPVTEAASPVFTLNNTEDFPTLGKAPSAEGTPCDVKSAPIASKVITPARKTTVTLQNSSKKPLKSPLDSGQKPSNARRRITPTAIVSQSVPSPTPAGFVSVTPVKGDRDKTNEAFTVAPECRMISLEEERKLLREARANRIAPAVEETTPQKTSRLREMLTKQFTPTKLLMEKMSSVTDALPELGQVSYQDKLDVLAQLYSFCLREFMVPNVTVELYFVIQLLTTRGLDAELAISYLNQDDNDDEICYLACVHNAVYFAVAVLEKQHRLLSLFDKGMLRLLVDNSRITDFSPILRDDLAQIIEKTQAKARPLPPSSPVLGVSFQADTDNRKNFPNDRAFHTFKKQRDIFYELLREWQEHHMLQGWTMREAQANRIKEVVGNHIDVTNHVHFARLFQSQLILMCKGDRSHKVEGDDQNISLLSELKQTNPDKFKRLQERFISPQSVGSPCPHPSFPGCQEFFRDFVITASSHMFNHHLTFTMVQKITDLNKTQFTSPEAEGEDQEAEIDPEDVETLTTCLLTLRLLGKFLGFVTFLPYQSPEKLPDTMEVAIINMRNQVPLPVDVAAAVQACLSGGSVVLTIPWVVEFLSMMDVVAPRLHHLQQVLTLLVQVYRSTSRELCQRKQTLTLLMVISTLGWLFELPVFPEGLFFKTFPYGPVGTGDALSVSDCVDKMDLVDHNLYFTCCPYVGEVKSLLMGFAVGSNNKGSSIRKITPMMTESEVSGSVSEKQLQLHLEESFFHNHPASMKRTVEFVADRVSSNYIKKFRAGHLPKLVQEGSVKVKEVIQMLAGGFDTRSKRKARQQVEDLSLDLVTKAHSLSTSEIPSYAFTKSGGILPLLLPEDTASQVLRVATAITGRLAQDKVVAWMATHITKAMFVREYSPELEKQLKLLSSETTGIDGTPAWDPLTTPATPRATPITSSAAADLIPTGKTHDASGDFPSQVMVDFKEVLRDLVIGECSLSSKDILQQIANVRWCLENRQDIISGVFKCMARMTTDLAYTLALRYPSLWTPEVKTALITVWTTYLKVYTDFTHILCPKHFHLITTAPDDQLAWQNLCDLILALLENQLTTPADMQTGASTTQQLKLPEWLSSACETFVKECASKYFWGTNRGETLPQYNPASEQASKQPTTTPPALTDKQGLEDRAADIVDTAETTETTNNIGVLVDSTNSDPDQAKLQSDRNPSERTVDNVSHTVSKDVVTHNLQSVKEGNNNTCSCATLPTCTSPGGTCHTCRQHTVPNPDLSSRQSVQPTAKSPMNCDAYVKPSDNPCQETSPDNALRLSAVVTRPIANNS